MFDDDSSKSRIIRAAMELARSRRWRDISLADIAREAQVSLAQLRQEFNSKVDILHGFQRHVDIALLERVADEKPEGSAKDRLADVVLTRLEILAPYKDALKAIRRDVCRTPSEVALLGCGAAVSSGWALAAAGIPAQGPKGRARIAGLMSVMARVFPIWLDDGPDNARTMAALDRRLSRGEDWLKMMDTVCADACGFARRLARCFCGPRRSTPEPVVTPTPPPAPEAAPVV